MSSKRKLESIFYKNVPKARRINPFFRSQFQLVYDASQYLCQGEKILNIFSSADLSSKREDLYKHSFFKHAQYHSIDFWEDQFHTPSPDICDYPPCKYRLPYPSNYFNVILTTKVILEHVSEPQLVVDEMYRVLKPGGKAFLIAPHIRRQHQAPHDYYRFTEYALNSILNKSGFTSISIQNSGGFMAVVGYYLYFFQRGLGVPKFIEKAFDFIHYWLLEPIFYGLDRLDNGYGRDMTLYFMITSTK